MTPKQLMRIFAKRAYNFARPYIIDDINLGESPGIVKSYSQTGEDLLIDAILGCKPTGTYVDVGANDPVVFSNTKRFYDRGWSGIDIEPQPHKWAELHKERTRDIVLNCGVSYSEGKFPFYISDNHTVSTFDPFVANHTNMERGTKTVSVLDIEVRRLDSILDEYLNGREIDFMSIDVEGREMGVLISNDWIKYRPEVIVIEYNHAAIEIKNYLSAVGYVPVFKNPENAIFVVRK